MPEEKDIHRELVPLLMRHERQIFAYIYTLVPNRHDAEDIRQETCLTIYDKFADFTQGTDFVAWAMRIAWWKVREALSDMAAETVAESNQRQIKLADCLQKINERDRRMILIRYERDGGVEQAAAASGRSVQAAYKSLMRIKQVLHDCVTNAMSQEEALS